MSPTVSGNCVCAHLKWQRLLASVKILLVSKWAINCETQAILCCSKSVVTASCCISSSRYPTQHVAIMLLTSILGCNKIHNFNLLLGHVKPHAQLLVYLGIGIKPLDLFSMQWVLGLTCPSS